METLARADRLRTTTVTLFELLSGAYEDARGENVRRLVQALVALPLDRAAATEAAKIRRKLDATGNAIGMGDSLIAGICVANGLQLLTGNRKHFARVPGLVLIDVEDS